MCDAWMSSSELAQVSELLLKAKEEKATHVASLWCLLEQRHVLSVEDINILVFLSVTAEEQTRLATLFAQVKPQNSHDLEILWQTLCTFPLYFPLAHWFHRLDHTTLDDYIWKNIRTLTLHQRHLCRSIYGPTCFPLEKDRKSTRLNSSHT